MLSLTRKQDYALTALAYLAEHPGRSVCAREIAEAHTLPLALLMNILKCLQKHEILKSTRGSTGGYQLAGDLADLTLCDLVRVLEDHGPIAGPCECEELVFGSAQASGPVEALKHRLSRFLHEVRLSDLMETKPLVVSGK